MKAIFQLAGVLLLALATEAAAEGVIGQTRGPDGPWDYASFDAAHHRVLVARSDGVMTLDTDTGVLAAFAPGARVHAVIALPDGRAPVYCPSGGCQSSTLLPSGSTTQPNLPNSDSSTLSCTSQPSLRRVSRSACRSSTR